VKQLLKQHAAYYGTVGIVLLTGSIIQLFCSKEAVQLWVDASHLAYLDVFFSYLTHLGDGLTFVIVILFMALWRSYYLAFEGLLSFATSGLFTQLLKRTVFADVLRPKGLLGAQLHYIAGVEVHTTHSFPSGHATTAFALATFLVLHSTPKNGILWALAAALVGFSRIYLNQHFLPDVLAGALIGTAWATAMHQLLLPLQQKDTWQRHLLP
jgi:membrane-associated phospholipid phosphatase